MLYQVIIRSSVIFSDEEFLDELKQVYEPRGTDFEVIEARSLDGIREEVWEKPSNRDEYGRLLHRTAGDDLSDLL